MSYRKYALVLLLAVSMPAMSQLTTQISSVEASPAVVNVPTSPSGKLSFKPCAQRCDADYITIRLTPGTRYLVQGRTVEFAEFRRDFFNRRRSAKGYTLVSYDTDKNTATSVQFSY